MKSKILNTLLCVCLCATLIFIQSCEVEEGPEPLVANAGEDFTAAPFTTVELDASGSTPVGEIQFEWEYESGPVDETKISLTDQNTATAKFIPPRNGVYYFTLTITRNIQYKEDRVTVTVDGVVTLTSSPNLTLIDIEPDPAKPDYKLNDILTLNNSNRMTTDGTGTNGIVIECSESAGVSITEGGHTMAGVKFTSTSGWKGIMISGGSSTLTNLIVEKGGKSLFESATETAAVTVKGGTVNMTNSIFNGTTGYDLLVLNNSAHTINNNQFKSVKPVKGPVSMVTPLSLNTYPETYDYITLTTPGASTYVTSVEGQTLRFGGNKKFYIDGDLSTSSNITIDPGATILMKENAGIVAGGGSSIQGSSPTKAVIQGINSSPWKGIVLAGSSSHIINGLILRDAGSAVFSTGSITTDVKAAIHVLINASLRNIELFNSKGYGISWGANDQPAGIFNNTFTDCAAAAIRAAYPFVNFILRENHDNTFTMPANVPAVELYGSGSLASTTIWRALNGNNFYLATSNILLSGNLTLLPGVKVKFASGKSISGSSKLTAIGTASAPVVLEGPIDSPGSWPGILLEGPFNLEFCEIKNGGQSLMLGASAPAALVIKYSGTVTADNFTFKNNLVTGSTGLGVLIELGAKDPGVTTPANNNSYSNNTAGNTMKK